MHTASNKSIALIGGGPVGLSCALLLHARGLPVQVFDARSPEESQRDARVLALSRGSWALLQPLLGDVALRRADILEVRVSSAGEWGSARLPAQSTEPLGATVRYGELMAALSQAATRAGLTIHHQTAVRTVEQSPTHVTLQLSDEHTVQTPLAIVAEGHTARPAQTADWVIVASVQIEDLPAGVAIERFTREGPLALLPEPSLPGQGTTRSLVWCMSESECARRTALPEAQFLAELRQALGPRIGTPTWVGARHRFALTQHVEPRVHRHRVVHIGNAAQTLHPVAGQGFNLGLRDATVLAQILALAQHPMEQALSTYTQARQADRHAIAALTQWLPPLFATRFTPLALARSAGLMALDLLPPLRHRLAHLLMFGVRI